MFYTLRCYTFANISGTILYNSIFIHYRSLENVSESMVGKKRKPSRRVNSSKRQRRNELIADEVECSDDDDEDDDDEEEEGKIHFNT